MDSTKTCIGRHQLHWRPLASGTLSTGRDVGSITTSRISMNPKSSAARRFWKKRWDWGKPKFGGTRTFCTGVYADLSQVRYLPHSLLQSKCLSEQWYLIERKTCKHSVFPSLVSFIQSIKIVRTVLVRLTTFHRWYSNPSINNRSPTSSYRKHHQHGLRININYKPWTSSIFCTERAPPRR